MVDFNSWSDYALDLVSKFQSVNGSMDDFSACGQNWGFDGYNVSQYVEFDKESDDPCQTSDTEGSFKSKSSRTTIGCSRHKCEGSDFEETLSDFNVEVGEWRSDHRKRESSAFLDIHHHHRHHKHHDDSGSELEEIRTKNRFANDSVSSSDIGTINQEKVPLYCPPHRRGVKKTYEKSWERTKEKRHQKKRGIPKRNETTTNIFHLKQRSPAMTLSYYPMNRCENCSLLDRNVCIGPQTTYVDQSWIERVGGIWMWRPYEKFCMTSQLSTPETDVWDVFPAVKPLWSQSLESTLSIEDFRILRHIMTQYDAQDEAQSECEKMYAEMIAQEKLSNESKYGSMDIKYQEENAKELAQKHNQNDKAKLTEEEQARLEASSPDQTMFFYSGFKADEGVGETGKTSQSSQSPQGDVESDLIEPANKERQQKKLQGDAKKSKSHLNLGDIQLENVESYEDEERKLTGDSAIGFKTSMSGGYHTLASDAPDFYKNIHVFSEEFPNAVNDAVNPQNLEGRSDRKVKGNDELVDGRKRSSGGDSKGSHNSWREKQTSSPLEYQDKLKREKSLEKEFSKENNERHSGQKMPESNGQGKIEKDKDDENLTYLKKREMEQSEDEQKKEQGQIVNNKQRKGKPKGNYQDENDAGEDESDDDNEAEDDDLPTVKKGKKGNERQRKGKRSGKDQNEVDEDKNNEDEDNDAEDEDLPAVKQGKRGNERQRKGKRSGRDQDEDKNDEDDERDKDDLDEDDENDQANQKEKGKRQNDDEFEDDMEDEDGEQDEEEFDENVNISKCANCECETFCSGAASSVLRGSTSKKINGRHVTNSVYSSMKRSDNPSSRPTTTRNRSARSGVDYYYTQTSSSGKSSGYTISRPQTTTRTPRRIDFRETKWSKGPKSNNRRSFSSWDRERETGLMPTTTKGKKYPSSSIVSAGTTINRDSVRDSYVYDERPTTASTTMTPKSQRYLVYKAEAKRKGKKFPHYTVNYLSQDQNGSGFGGSYGSSYGSSYETSYDTSYGRSHEGDYRGSYAGNHGRNNGEFYEKHSRYPKSRNVYNKNYEYPKREEQQQRKTEAKNFNIWLANSATNSQKRLSKRKGQQRDGWKLMDEDAFQNQNREFQQLEKKRNDRRMRLKTEAKNVPLAK